MGKTLGTVMGIVNVGALISPPLGGIAYSQGGVVAVAALGSGVFILDLTMRILLIERRFAIAYMRSPSSSDTESSEQGHGRTHSERQGEHRQEVDSTEESPLLGCRDTSSDYYLPPTQNVILQYAPILSCLRNPSLIVIIIICGIQSALMGAFDATISLEAIDVFNFNSLQAGFFFVPLVCLRLAAGPIGGWAVDRLGTKPVAVLGHAFLVPILISFRLVKAEPRLTQITLYCVLLGLSGIGLAVTSTPGFVESGAIVKKYHERNPSLFGVNGPYASLYGMNSMAFSIGMTVGPSLAGFLRDK